MISGWYEGNIRRIDPYEIGKNDAYCPKCGYNGGELKRLRTQDSLKCGNCGKQTKVINFLREAKRRFPDQEISLLDELEKIEKLNIR